MHAAMLPYLLTMLAMRDEHTAFPSHILLNDFA